MDNFKGHFLQDFQIVVFQTNHTSMEILFIQLSDYVYILIKSLYFSQEATVWRNLNKQNWNENILMTDLFLTNMQLFTSQNINWWSCVDYWGVCISCLDSHSFGTHSLQRIHCCASDVMQNYSNLFWWRNKLIYILDGLTVSKCSFFWWTVFL